MIRARRGPVIAVAAVALVAAAGCPSGGPPALDPPWLDTARIEGHVVDYPEGQPIAGMSVVAFDVQARYVIATTDDDGRYTIEGLAPDFYRVKAWPLDGQDYIGAYFEDLYFYCTGQLLDLRAGGTAAAIDFRLPHGGRLRGTVTDADGEPLVDARVDVRGLDYYNANLDPTAYTDDDGVFEIVGLDSAIEDVESMTPVPGNYELKVTVPGRPLIYWPGVYDAADAEPVTALRNELHDGVDLVIPDGGSIGGVVVDDEGVPATGGSVRARHAELSWISTTAGIHDDGSFAVSGLAPGPWSLEVHADGLASATFDDDLELAEDGALEDLSLALGEEARLEGTIVGLDEPRADVTVRATPVDGGPELSVRSDADGTFAIGGLRAGDYTLQLSQSDDRVLDGHVCGTTICGPDDDPEPFAAAVGETLALGTVALPPASAIAGRIEERESGRPLGRIYVTAIPERDGAPSPLAVSDDDGSYRVGGLPPGEYTLQAEPYRYCSTDPGWPTTYSGDARRPDDALVLSLGAGAELPLDLSLPADVDADGMADLWEWLQGLDPTRDDGLEDPDLDGIYNIDEYLEGTDPRDDLADGARCDAGGPGTAARAAWSAGVLGVLALLVRRRARRTGER